MGKKRFVLWLALTIILISIISLFVVVPYIQMVINRATLDARVTNKILSSDRWIRDYEFFKQQYQDYLAINKKIKIASDSIARFKKFNPDSSKWNYQIREEYDRLSSIVTGLEYQKMDIISKYNARSQSWTRTGFGAKTSDLPYILE